MYDWIKTAKPEDSPTIIASFNKELKSKKNPLIPRKIIVPPKPKILSMAYAKQAINAIVEKFGI